MSVLGKDRPVDGRSPQVLAIPPRSLLTLERRVFGEGLTTSFNIFIQVRTIVCASEVHAFLLVLVPARILERSVRSNRTAREIVGVVCFEGCTVRKGDNQWTNGGRENK